MKKTKKGFTLVELVIVVAVMAILVAVAIPTVASITNTAKEAVDDTNAQTIESMLKLAIADKAKTGASATVALTGAEIDTAITNAKLGISKDCYFVYDPATGDVTVASSGTAVSGKYVITFDADATDDSAIAVNPTT